MDKTEREGIVDNTMDKQSAFFGTSQLYRSCDLAGPATASALHIRNVENLEALGGMRRPDRSVQQHDTYGIIGAELHSMAVKFITDHPHILSVVQNLRKGVVVSGFSDDVASLFRNKWFSTLGSPTPPRLPGPDSDAI